MHHAYLPTGISANPPVSTTVYSNPPNAPFFSRRSRVVPGVLSTIALRELVSRLKSVLLPTFVLPTIRNNFDQKNNIHEHNSSVPNAIFILERSREEVEK